MTMETPAGGSETVTERRWTRSTTIGMADVRCTGCGGIGLVRTRNGSTACKCVLKAICRAVVERLHQIFEQQGKASGIALQSVSGATRPKSFSYSRPLEEFAADAFLVARRELSAEENDIFRYAMILGADWKMMTRRLKMDRGNYFHAYYRTECKLGEAWAMTMPYRLYPFDEYFGGVGNREIDAEAARTGN